MVPAVPRGLVGGPAALDVVSDGTRQVETIERLVQGDVAADRDAEDTDREGDPEIVATEGLVQLELQ